MKQNIIIETGRGEPLILATAEDIKEIFEAKAEAMPKLMLLWGQKLCFIKTQFSDKTVERHLFSARYKEHRIAESEKSPSDAALERELKGNDEYQLRCAECGRLEAAISEVEGANQALLFISKTLIQ